MSDLLKLNIGAGDTTIPGFISHDIKDGKDASDLSEYEDGSVEEIYASHVLEHVHHSLTGKTLAEWERVLVPGGGIRIAVPDFDRIRRDYDNGHMDDNLYNAYLYGAYPHERDWHQSHFGRGRLIQWLMALGFEDMADFEPEYDDSTKGCSYSMNIEAHKREFVIPENPRVSMVLSTPRFGPIDFNHCALNVAKALGWEFCYHGGTEWGAGLTKAIESVIETGSPDYIMNLDFDSTFTAEDCLELLRLMQENPEAAAIYPVQWHRHLDKPLGYFGNYEYEGELTRVRTGHFGCTMIRTEALRKLPHPWFFSMPDPETGRWDGDKLDADIYFWQQMIAYGFKAYQANNVVIGHMELCVMWPNRGGTMYQPIQHWRKHGKPPKAVFDPDAIRQSEKEGKTTKKRMWSDPHDTVGARGEQPEPVPREDEFPPKDCGNPIRPLMENASGP